MCTMAITESSTTAGTKLTRKEVEKIQRLVQIGEYLGMSDFLRTAVREKLEAIEIVEVKDMDYETAKKEILGYYQKHREAYPDEAANALGIDLELTMKIAKQLIEEKRLGEID